MTILYSDPLYRKFEPPVLFSSPDPAERTLHYCGLFNNGVAEDGSPDPETVTRFSRLPNSVFVPGVPGRCKPVACAAGRIGAACNGVDDDATCDSSPGAGDGDCDACRITGGESTENEMFILIGDYYVEGADPDDAGGPIQDLFAKRSGVQRSSFTGIAVAKTISSGLVDAHFVTQGVLMCALVGCIIWNLITWWYGLPSSSSHALLGGYAGAAVARAGFAAIIPAGWTKTLIFIVLSPLIGMVAGYVLMVALFWTFRHTAPMRVDRWFRRLQLLSAAAFSLMHGANDAQKTMGIIAGVLFTAGYLDHFYIPFWVVLIAHTAIALGTLSGGWRIIHTMGQRITKLQPVHGFAAETTAAMIIHFASTIGIPLSTTHAISTSIMGVGAVKRFGAVKWGVVERILWAWVFTLPVCGLLGYLIEKACVALGYQ